ncbi:MAG: methionine--tRNA ligase [Bradymonadales bacterium]|nr:MAG: methionine--tRNA ligase [Bradymonadales bacterium]
MPRKFYITTAIDYPNGSPHMGHAYEKLISDCYARWYRFRGDQVHFLTGTDENGQKLVRAAEEAGEPTKDFVDLQVDKFRKLCADLGLSHSDFIRTTEARHKEAAQELWERLQKKSKIYFGQYEGQYCLSCEAFYTELQAADGKCPAHGSPLERVKEDGYFFKLSEYAEWIEAHIRDNENFVWPKAAHSEILNRIRSEKIRDLSVSRPNHSWGIPVPGDEKHVMYTWFDALINYWSAVRNSEEKWWPASVHVIGKDIVWFHAVIWPCLLKAADLELPEQVFVHGMVLGQDGRKMSKTLGNGVDPYQIIGQFPLDSFRYYLLRAIPSGGDGAFVIKDLVMRHNTELANDFGNLLSRVVKLALKKGGETWESRREDRSFDFPKLFEKLEGSMTRREHHRALESLWLQINQLNLYLNDQAPWKMEAGSEALKSCLSNALFGIFGTAVLAQAFLPEVSRKILQTLGQPEVLGPEVLAADSVSFRLQSPEPLFPKIEWKEES